MPELDTDRQSQLFGLKAGLKPTLPLKSWPGLRMLFISSQAMQCLTLPYQYPVKTSLLLVRNILGHLTMLFKLLTQIDSRALQAQELEPNSTIIVYDYNYC